MNFKGYINGNYQVFISESDGTKIRTTSDDFFDAVFPENCDMKVTNYCNFGCEFCHECSTEKGKHAKVFDKDGNVKEGYAFLNTLKPYTELALGGGRLTSWPEIDTMLDFLKTKKVFANITVNYRELHEESARIQQWIDMGLIYGIGISIDKYDEEVMRFAQKNPNTVLHVIAGFYDVDEIIKSYGNKGLKILILGYKNWGRGAVLLKDADFHNNIDVGMMLWEDVLPVLFESFKVVSFDNLALKQLNIQKHVSEDVWNMNYMGDDSTATMYIDLPNKEFAASSTAKNRFELKQGIIDMFKEIKNTLCEKDRYEEHVEKINTEGIQTWSDC